MNAQIADFQLKFTADSVQFNRDVEYAKKMLRGYAKEANAANDENLGLSQSLKQASEQARVLSSGFLTVAGSVTAGLGSVTAATGYLITKQADQARELERMATVSQLSVEQIQALSYASEQYGISGDKMADILKDVNDKMGDFSQTGGGEMADFFNNILPQVNLTTEQLQKMSGPDALIAVKDAMDKANVPMKDQIHYLEDIADDASALLPLLENHGEKLKSLTRHYDDLNVAMSETDIQNFKEMDQQLTDSGLKIQRAFANAIVGSKKQIDWMTGYLVNAINYWGALFDSWNDDPRTADGALKKVSELRSAAMPARKELAALEVQLKSANKNNYVHNAWDSLGKDDLKKKVERKRKQLKALDDEIDKYQKKYEVLSGLQSDPNKDNQPPSLTNPDKDPKRPDNTQYDDKKLDALDMQLASETEKMRLAHEQRLTDIDSYNVSASALKKRGFDSIDALRAEYREKENESYQSQVDDYNEKREQQVQKTIQQMQDAEAKKTEIAKREAEKRAKTEKRLDQSVFQMKTEFANNTLSLIESSATQGSAIQKAAFLAQKTLNAYLVIQQGEVAASAALNPLYGLGPEAGQGYAASIRMMAYASAGLIMGQALAGMAHSGISRVPEEGTWLLNKGERVYTNHSAEQIDAMYGAVMSVYQQVVGARLSSQSRQSAPSGNASPVYQFNMPMSFDLSGSASEEDAQAISALVNQKFYELVTNEKRPGGALWTA